MNAKARSPVAKKAAAKKAVPKSKAVKPVAKPKAKASSKPAVKKAKPAAKPKAVPKKSSSAKKPVVAKKPTAVKKAKPVKKTLTAKKPAASQKPVAKKAKPVKKAVPAKKALTSKKPAPKKPAPKKAPPKKAAPAKKALAAKKSTPVKKAAPVKAAAPKTSSKSTPAKAVAAKKSAAPVAVPVATKPEPQLMVPGATVVVHKKNSRAAKMAALVPPPPAPVVVTNAAKSSFVPYAAPAHPSVIPVIPKKDAKLANNWKTKSVEQLSDAEVIAMPDSEYMNDVQMAFFRRKLVSLKDEVLSNASETTEHLREDTVVVPDPADRATIEEEHALELRTRDRERKLLKKIEQSIARIDAGDYGYCDETGEPIGVGRLIARPTATLSLEAQERRELKQKMFGD
ncbi:MAG: polymerase-binding transcription factor DksA [Pseudomonadota bacterium]